jgi:hypothetical protein
MLQRTSRLRDALERRGGFTASDVDRAGGGALAFVTEAEFVTPSDTFPSEFRWEALTSCYRIYTRLASGQTTFFDLTCCQMGTTVDVLWLSPTVFVSPLHISVGEDQEVDPPRIFYDCEIEFLQREEPSTATAEKLVPRAFIVVSLGRRTG